ncbi:hypothetical protein JZU71_02595, partial [bacterium]|nr:hypothetical protein [bacterium]
AMLCSVIAEFRRVVPGGEISIITTPESTVDKSRFSDINFLPIWGKYRLVGPHVDVLASASALAVIGADIMDGYYWPMTVLRIAMLCERVRLHGGQVGILGFSFNAAPDPSCVEVLGTLMWRSV